MVRLFAFIFLGIAVVFITVGILCSYCDPLAHRDNAFYYLCGALFLVSGIILLPAPNTGHDAVDDDAADDDDDDVPDDDDLDDGPDDPEDVRTDERQTQGPGLAA